MATEPRKLLPSEVEAARSAATEPETPGLVHTEELTFALTVSVNVKTALPLNADDKQVLERVMLERARFGVDRFDLVVKTLRRVREHIVAVPGGADLEGLDIAQDIDDALRGLPR